MNVVLLIIGGLSFIGTFIPFIKSNHWLVRSHLYFRILYLILSSIVLALVLIFEPFTIENKIATILLSVAILYCLYSIYPFTPFYKKSIDDTDKDYPKRQLHILIFNVYQDNDDYQKTLSKVKEINPDIAFFVETNKIWANHLLSLKDSFPYSLSEPLDNTYGMVCLCKHTFIDSQIKYLVKDDVPSMEFAIKLGSETIRIFGVHPEPPTPMEATYSTPKDLELIKVAKDIKKLPKEEHVILIGDLNDVAWSRMTKAIKRITEMVDPREGRGFFCTFPTYFPITIPLDHVFCSPSFELKRFEILEDIGSDHYPVNVILQLKNRVDNLPKHFTNPELT